MKSTAKLKIACPPMSTSSLLCYLAADNDLSSYSLLDVEEASLAGRPANVHMGMELDTRGNLGSIRYEITEPDFEGRGHRTVVERLPEQDSGSFITLRNFLDWGIRRSDAKHRFVVIWGHGMGNAIAPDFQSMGESLSVPRLVEAFFQAGFGDPEYRRDPNWSDRSEGRVAVLGFDACNMASIENIWGVRHVAQMVIASQEKIPATGWPYADLVRVQSEFKRRKPASDTVLGKIGEAVTKAYIDSYHNLGITAITLSAVRTNEKLKELVTLTNKLGEELATALSKEKPEKSPVRFACDDARLCAQGFHLGDFVDLAHFAQLLAINIRIGNTELAMTADNLFESIKNSVAVISKCGYLGEMPNPEVADANGLSVWFPAQRPRYLSRRSQYKVDNGREFDGWIHFLDSYYK